MTISDLITQLSAYPADARVTLLDADRRWLLPIQVKSLPAYQSSCGTDFVAITSADDCDEIEGLVIQLPRIGAATHPAATK
jgi:hypothetical protein